jgi:hypothetical protein
MSGRAVSIVSTLVMLNDTPASCCAWTINFHSVVKKSAKKHRADTRPGKRRFGLYRYLRDVYQAYLELRSRRIARKATRRIAKISKLSLRKKSHPIRILIEASAGPEDNRAKSRWTQALKYAYGWRQPAKRLKWFFEEAGGIAGSARKYADLQAQRKATKIMTTAEPGPGK